MIKIFSYFIIVILLFALNAGFFKAFELFGTQPNMLFLLVIFVALEGEGDLYLPLSFVCGLILDLSTAVMPGSFALSFLLVALILRPLSREVVELERNWKFLPLVLLFSQVVVFGWVYLYNQAALRLNQPGIDFYFKEMAGRFFWELVYNLLLLYPIKKLATLPISLQAKFFPRTK